VVIRTATKRDLFVGEPLYLDDALENLVNARRSAQFPHSRQGRHEEV